MFALFVRFCKKVLILHILTNSSNLKLKTIHISTDQKYINAIWSWDMEELPKNLTSNDLV